jgi:hypothetical protein
MACNAQCINVEFYKPSNMISSFLYPFLLCYFLCLLHLCVACFLRLAKTMVALYILNCFKFKLFFTFGPHVGFIVHESFISSQNLISSDNIETMNDVTFGKKNKSNL